MLKKPTKKQKMLFDADETMISLKKRYFKSLALERYPKTLQITKLLDTLTTTIEARKKEIIKVSKNKR
jgi:hypothetical protein|tara:strand:- start:15097 stop:15300 length:204 start_codon:yes stop_codon:yes gene_type:complete